VENIKNVPVTEEARRKVIQSGDWRRKVLISVLIAAAAGAIMFVFYLLLHGRITEEGVITIVVVITFCLIFSMSLLDRLGI
jgi:hypothetical protein